MYLGIDVGGTSIKAGVFDDDLISLENITLHILKMHFQIIFQIF
jgi:sugar (pentulose or hexulose) kinase